MQTDFTPTYSSRKGQGVYWTGILLRNLASAQAYWSADQDMWKESVASYLKALEIFDASRGTQDPRFIPPYQAGDWLCQQLFSTDNTFVSPASVDQAARSLWWTNPTQRNHNRASLLLNHPSGPDPTAALQFWRWADEQGRNDPFVEDLFALTARAATYHVFWNLVETAQALDKGGQRKDARWVLDLGRRRLPQLFIHHTQRGLPVISSRFRVKATAEQIREGVPGDTHGAILRRHPTVSPHIPERRGWQSIR